MKCLVVDDDPLVCEEVVQFTSKIPFVEFCVQAPNGIDALNLLNASPFDCLFLDLEMPGIDGRLLLDALPERLQVVIITADSEFAAASYRYDVADYLIKPLSFDRVFKALQRVRQRQEGRFPMAAARQDHLFVKDGTAIIRIPLDSIRFIKAEANYVRFVCHERTIMSLMSMKRVEEVLPPDFLRVHRSFVVHARYIDRIEGNEVLMGKERVPVGESYRDQLLTRINLVR